MIRYPGPVERGLDQLEEIGRTRLVTCEDFIEQLVDPFVAEGNDLANLSSALSTREIWLPPRYETMPSGETREFLDEVERARARLRNTLLASEAGLEAAAGARGEGVAFKDFERKLHYSAVELRALGDATHRFARQALEAGVAASAQAGESEVGSAWTAYEKVARSLADATLPMSLCTAIELSRDYGVVLTDLWPAIVRGHEKATALFVSARGHRYSVYAAWWLRNTVAYQHHPLRSSPSFDAFIRGPIGVPRSAGPRARAGAEIPLLELELAATLDLLGARNLRHAEVLHRLGRARATLDQPGSRNLYEQALRLREELLGPHHLEVGATLLSLSSRLAAEGTLPLAEETGLRALAIFERNPGRGDASLAAQLNNLTNLYLRAERPAQAEAQLTRLIEFARRPEQISPLHLSDSLQRLAQLYADLGEARKAEELRARATHLSPEPA